MAAKDFPASPVAGQVFENWVWNATNESWDSLYNGTPPAMLQVSKYADASARTTAIPSPAEGMITYLDDINQFQGYAGTSWRPIGGLAPIVPPTVAVSGGTATANTLGTVSFSGVTSIRLDNIFTSAYKNYCIKYSIKCSATSDIRHQLVSAGTVNTTAAYNNAGPAWITNALSSFSNAAGNNWMLSVSTSNADDMTAADIQLFNPAVATRTLVVSSSSGHDGTNAKHFWTNGVHTLASAYDGFYIFPVSGNLSGTLTVYGYNS